jgi:hypothetical protein
VAKLQSLKVDHPSRVKLATKAVMLVQPLRQNLAATKGLQPKAAAVAKRSNNKQPSLNAGGHSSGFFCLQQLD